MLLFSSKIVPVSYSDNLADKTCMLSYQLSYDGGFFKSIYGLGKLTSKTTIENIDYGFYTAGNSLGVIEKGFVKGLFGTYQSGDLFQIKLTDSTATYYRNQRFVYSSRTTNDFKCDYTIMHVLIDEPIKNFRYKNVIYKCNFQKK